MQRVALMKGAQIGGTECGNCWIGYVTSLTFSRISQFQGSIKRAGSPVGNLTHRITTRLAQSCPRFGG